MRGFGAFYRAFYAAQGLLSTTGCPQAGSIFIWADAEQRTRATGDALADGFGTDCKVTAHSLAAGPDTLFHALPTLGKVDPIQARAGLLGSIGGFPDAVVHAYGLTFAKLDAILGCQTGACKVLSTEPSEIKTDKAGLPSLSGSIALGSTAAENLLLEYAEGMPVVGWGKVDRTTLLELSQLHGLKESFSNALPYSARAGGSNLLRHVLATIDQTATGMHNAQTRAPVSSRFVAFVGHDTNIAQIAGMLHLSWFLPGYQQNDLPPEGALAFETLQRQPGAMPFIRTYFIAQSLDQMHRGALATSVEGTPARAPVYIPGCPSLDCPLTTFDAVVASAIDPTFVGSW